MSSESLAEIEDLAGFVADENWRSGRVDLSGIAKAAGITFNFGSYGDYFDGYLECRHRRFHIYINLGQYSSGDVPRARFSFAHELGHYFIDHHRLALERGAPSHGSMGEFSSNAVVERQADAFAANLLLPKDKLRRAASGRVGGAEIQELAARFGASITATAIRCALLSVSPLIVMKWTESGRAWCWSSENYSEVTGNKAHRALERVPKESITRQAISGDLGSTSVQARGTTLATWFPSVFSGSSRDEILMEECISLGQYGVLTILRPA